MKDNNDIFDVIEDVVKDVEVEPEEEVRTINDPFVGNIRINARHLYGLNDLSDAWDRMTNIGTGYRDVWQVDPISVRCNCDQIQTSTYTYPSTGDIYKYWRTTTG